MVLGKRLTNHAFQVSMSYDYNELIRQIVFFNTESGMNPISYTAESTPIVPSIITSVATGNPVLQFRIKPTIQKCESIQLTIEDVPLSGELGAGYTLTGLSALLGLNTSRQLPLPTSQTIGR
jgi:hypothetical protein